MEKLIKKKVNELTGAKFYLKKVRILGTYNGFVYVVICYWNNLQEADATVFQTEDGARYMFDFLAN